MKISKKFFYGKSLYEKAKQDTIDQQPHYCIVVVSAMSDLTVLIYTYRK